MAKLRLCGGLIMSCLIAGLRYPKVAYVLQVRATFDRCTPASLPSSATGSGRAQATDFAIFIGERGVVNRSIEDGVILKAKQKALRLECFLFWRLK